jgi:hypothetical protein
MLESIEAEAVDGSRIVEGYPCGILVEEKNV